METADIIIWNLTGLDSSYCLAQFAILAASGANLNNSPTACDVGFFFGSFVVGSHLLLILLAATRYSVLKDPSLVGCVLVAALQYLTQIATGY